MYLRVRDGVHERHIDFYSFSDQVFNFAKHGKIVLGLDVVGIRSVKTRDKTTKGRDADTFTNTEYG